MLDLWILFTSCFIIISIIGIFEKIFEKMIVKYIEKNYKNF